ncbi:MAG: nucleotidyl transferase AbiEii/AbiGii toxin family protein [Succinimonas sp.]|nr:nucleotidyl transferase AbiEii/AbiGii toxin family protein [Succinimonas sp.]
MLNQYHAAGLTDKKNAVKEIMQEIVLCGLSRAGFFQKAAFYGGTALRIFTVWIASPRIWIFHWQRRIRRSNWRPIFRR